MARTQSYSQVGRAKVSLVIIVPPPPDHGARCVDDVTAQTPPTTLVSGEFPPS